MGGQLIQSRHGGQGNFEVVGPPSHGGGLRHLWRDNDHEMRWSAPTCFGGGADYVGAAMVQSNYGDVGNLEVVAVDAEGNLDFFWRTDGDGFVWSGPFRIASGFTGTPALIQSRFGEQGNFEVVVPHREGGLAHLWRDNDHEMRWSAPTRFGGQARYVGAAMVQSNYGDVGNLEVVAVDAEGNLDFFWRTDGDGFLWSGPFRIASGFTGTPALIQSRFGEQGNFEVVVARREGGLAHLWRDNDHEMRWSAPTPFAGDRPFTGANLIQSNYGDTGNLEVIALDESGAPWFCWRTDGDGFVWSGPFLVGTEVSFPVSECIYGWTAAYWQGDTHVLVRIQLQPDANVTAATMDTLRTRWRDGIIAKWSNRFDCRAANGERKPLTFDVQWVDSGAHHVVRVIQGPAGSDLGTWDTQDTGDVASHEFGHMLGHPDEYPSSTCPMRNPVDTDTVMDDNTETVARLYDRLTGLHCGHTPAARLRVRTEVLEQLSPTLRRLDTLAAPERRASLERLRAQADLAAEPVGAADAVVSFEVSGGAPGERYEYVVEVAGDGTTAHRLLDEIRGDGIPNDGHESVVEAGVGRELAAQVFAAAEEAGVLAERAPRLLPRRSAPIPPDALVATLTVREGDHVRQIVVPAAEAGRAEDLPGAATEVPLRTRMLLPEDSVSRLEPVLSALARVEAVL